MAGLFRRNVGRRMPNVECKNAPPHVIRSHCHAPPTPDPRPPNPASRALPILPFAFCILPSDPVPCSLTPAPPPVHCNTSFYPRPVRRIVLAGDFSGAGTRDEGRGTRAKAPADVVAGRCACPLIPDRWSLSRRRRGYNGSASSPPGGPTCIAHGPCPPPPAARSTPAHPTAAAVNPCSGAGPVSVPHSTASGLLRWLSRPL